MSKYQSHYLTRWVTIKYLSDQVWPFISLVNTADNQMMCVKCVFIDSSMGDFYTHFQDIFIKLKNILMATVIAHLKQILYLWLKQKWNVTIDKFNNEKYFSTILQTIQCVVQLHVDFVMGLPCEVLPLVNLCAVYFVKLNADAKTIYQHLWWMPYECAKFPVCLICITILTMSDHFVAKGNSKIIFNSLEER